MKKLIKTDKAPGAIGPYNQATEIDGLVFTSGRSPWIRPRARWWPAASPSRRRW